MSDSITLTAWNAAQDFIQAHRRAALQEILAWFTGEQIGLLSFEDVRKKLKVESSTARGLQQIPLDAIVGSVGRNNDFTRDFLPLQSSDKERWVRVKMAMADARGVPPIDVYQIGQAYFVSDGNHRVSIAKQLGATHIEAIVTEIKTKVMLCVEDKPDDLIIKAEYADFLEHTQLDNLRHEADLSVTTPGQYRILEEHIQVHRYYMGLDRKRDIPYNEAVTHWYDIVYLPVTRLIRSRGLLKNTPNRTETDLYLWLADRRAALEKELGWEIRTEVAATTLVHKNRPRRQSLTVRLGEKFLDTILPEELESGPPPGDWLHDRPERDARHLFSDVLVPLRHAGESWSALDQAIQITHQENARLFGLHILPANQNQDSQPAQVIKTAFETRCQQAGIFGKLVFTDGVVWRQIANRARWVDLLVLDLTYPPAPFPLARLSSGFCNLIRHCPIPILAIPGKPTPLKRAILAYDGSPKSQEALYIATYLAGIWQISLKVITVFAKNIPTETLLRAQVYLDSHGIQAEYEALHGSVVPNILLSAKIYQSDLIIFGGYGNHPLVEVAFGSKVDELLRLSRQPMLICR